MNYRSFFVKLLYILFCIVFVLLDCFNTSFQYYLYIYVGCIAVRSSYPIMATGKISRCVHIKTIENNSWEDIYRKKAVS